MPWLEHCVTTARGKTHGKTWGDPNGVQNWGFCHYIKVAPLVFVNIAQDCSLGQCLTSSRAETSNLHRVSTQTCLFKVQISLGEQQTAHSFFVLVTFCQLSVYHCGNFFKR